jgi:hypothetical protein
MIKAAFILFSILSGVVAEGENTAKIFFHKSTKTNPVVAHKKFNVFYELINNGDA